MGSLYLGNRAAVLPESKLVAGGKDAVTGGDKDMGPSAKEWGGWGRFPYCGIEGLQLFPDFIERAGRNRLIGLQDVAFAAHPAVEAVQAFFGYILQCPLENGFGDAPLVMDRVGGPIDGDSFGKGEVYLCKYG